MMKIAETINRKRLFYFYLPGLIPLHRVSPVFWNTQIVQPDESPIIH